MLLQANLWLERKYLQLNMDPKIMLDEMALTVANISVCFADIWTLYCYYSSPIKCIHTMYSVNNRRCA